MKLTSLIGMLHDVMHKPEPLGQPLEQWKAGEGLAPTLVQRLERLLKSVIGECPSSKGVEEVNCMTPSEHALEFR